MKRVLITSAVVALALPSTMNSVGTSFLVAEAQPSDDRKIRDSMKRVTQGLDQAEKNIDRIKSSTSERTLENIAKKIDRAEGQLQALDSSVDGYAEQESRIASLRARLAESLQAANNLASQRDADREKLAGLQASGQTAEDDAFVRNANMLAASIKFMDFEHNHLVRQYSPRQEYTHYAANFPPTLERIRALLDTYGKMDPRDVREFSGPSLAMLVQEGGPEFTVGEEKLENFGAPAIAVASQKLSAAETEARSAIDEGRPADILDNQIIYGALHYLENVAAVYRSRPDTDAGLLGQYEELEARAENDVQSLISKAMSEIVKNNKPVANMFNDSDRSTIEQMVRERWANAYPKDEIISVRIPQSSWVRRREPGWRDGYLIMFDYSTVTPYIVVKEPDSMASQWGMVAAKDHTLDGKLSVSFGRLRTEKLDPRYTVLESALD